MHDLLNEPLIRYRTNGGNVTLAALPQVYSALIGGEITSFPALRPHQRHAWHAFLVQLGTMALHRSGRNQGPFPDDADDWSGLLRYLTSDYLDDDPWHLVVSDIAKPAFMQPPSKSTERERDFRFVVSTPDQLDVLVTSRNHELKVAVAAEARCDDWIFALVTLQTMEGYQGSHNYGISRMPSGYGNRSAFTLTPTTDLCGHFRHDLSVLLSERHRILNEYGLADEGIQLLWTLPWDGRKVEKLAITQLDPFYIEICRRIRLQEMAGIISGLRAPSEDRRIFNYKGLVGDPWMPVGNRANASGTPPAFLGSRKFNYERVIQVFLSADWKRPLLLNSSYISAEGYLIARGMLRGEGKTGGYHERVIPLRRKTLDMLGSFQPDPLFKDVSLQRIKQAETIQVALRYGIAAFASGGADRRATNEERSRARPWVAKLNASVDGSFFSDLQDELEERTELERQSIRREWASQLVRDAERLLAQATASLPCRQVKRHRASSAAERAFWGTLRGPNGIPDMLRQADLMGTQTNA
ncbi:MAG: hypothetical protein OXR67_15285 [Chloroflexota bacterium]|nr:hypothetical protein [Chloroflexota bacterium]